MKSGSSYDDGHLRSHTSTAKLLRWEARRAEACASPVPSLPLRGPRRQLQPHVVPQHANSSCETQQTIYTIYTHIASSPRPHREIVSNDGKLHESDRARKCKTHQFARPPAHIPLLPVIVSILHENSTRLPPDRAALAWALSALRLRRFESYAPLRSVSVPYICVP